MFHYNLNAVLEAAQRSGFPASIDHYTIKAAMRRSQMAGHAVNNIQELLAEIKRG